MDTVAVRGAPTTKKRLEIAFDIIETIRKKRVETNAPALGWAIERAVINRELNELELDILLNPPVFAFEVPRLRPERNPGGNRSRPWQ